jgi:arylesterase / paraoxonase
MKRIGKILGIVLGITLVGVAVLAFDFLRHGGQFNALQPRFVGTCATIALEASAEDIQIDRERGIAFLSYLDRRGLVEGKAVTGTVMLLDLNVAEPRPRAALAFEPPDFRPHGMSLSRPANGAIRLFAINHRPDRSHSVEIFERSESGAFTPIDSVIDPLFVKPNAIAALGSKQFYVANDSGATNAFERLQEFLFRRGLSTLVYYNGTEARIVDEKLKSAAGIALSPDTTRLYVAETLGKTLRVYQRDLASGAVELLESVPLEGAPDNLNVAEDGSVWIAMHAKTLALIRSFGDATKVAPTSILRYDPSAPETDRLTTIYVNDGSEISAGSVAASIANRFVVGSITDPKVLLCTRQ